MRRHFVRLLGLTATTSLAILWLIAVPTASAGDPCYHSFDMPTITIEATNQIKLMPCAFGPTVAQVPVGSKVTFFNGPDLAHLVTGANQTWGSRDTEIQPGGTVSYTFDTAGAYPYACALHRGMSGTIIVGDAVAATGGGSTGAGTITTGATGTTAATDATTAAGGLDGAAMLALAVATGIVVGAAAALVVSRRRRHGEGPTSPQAA